MLASPIVYKIVCHTLAQSASRGCGAFSQTPANSLRPLQARLSQVVVVQVPFRGMLEVPWRAQRQPLNWRATGLPSPKFENHRLQRIFRWNSPLQGDYRISE